MPLRLQLPADEAAVGAGMPRPPSPAAAPRPPAAGPACPGRAARPRGGRSAGAASEKINNFPRVKSCLAGACSWRLTQTVRGSTPSPPVEQKGGGGIKAPAFAIQSLVNLDDNG